MTLEQTANDWWEWEKNPKRSSPILAANNIEQSGYDREVLQAVAQEKLNFQPRALPLFCALAATSPHRPSRRIIPGWVNGCKYIDAQLSSYHDAKNLPCKFF